MTAWERHRKYPNVWIHLLGMTPNHWLNALPINSGDSSTWLSSVRWSGYNPRSMGATMGKMVHGFQYEYGAEKDSSSGHVKGCALSAYGAFVDMINWRNHIKELTDLGFTIYPKLNKGEIINAASKSNPA
jgi:hypothetical protein